MLHIPVRGAWRSPWRRQPTTGPAESGRTPDPAESPSPTRKLRPLGHLHHPAGRHRHPEPPQRRRSNPVPVARRHVRGDSTYSEGPHTCWRPLAGKARAREGTCASMAGEEHHTAPRRGHRIPPPGPDPPPHRRTVAPSRRRGFPRLATGIPPGRRLPPYGRTSVEVSYRLHRPPPAGTPQPAERQPAPGRGQAAAEAGMPGVTPRRRHRLRLAIVDPFLPHPHLGTDLDRHVVDLPPTLPDVRDSSAACASAGQRRYRKPASCERSPLANYRTSL